MCIGEVDVERLNGRVCDAKDDMGCVGVTSGSDGMSSV